MKNISKCLVASICLLFTLSAIAGMYPTPSDDIEFPLHVGVFNARIGKNQHIPVKDLDGDEFYVNSNNDTNVLFGAGFFMNKLWDTYPEMSFGVDVFYLGNAQTKGYIDWERIFRNVAYSYRTYYIPIYYDVKYKYVFQPGKSLVFDVGIGPDVIVTNSYREWALDPNAVPDNVYKGTTRAAFSVTAGVGVRLDNIILNKYPVEFGYRFFFLGQGSLKARDSDVFQNELKTGQNYAHSFVVSVIL